MERTALADIPIFVRYVGALFDIDCFLDIEPVFVVVEIMQLAYIFNYRFRLLLRRL